MPIVRTFQKRPSEGVVNLVRADTDFTNSTVFALTTVAHEPSLIALTRGQWL